jgi:CheY-like chemotaxis protein
MSEARMSATLHTDSAHATNLLAMRALSRPADSDFSACDSVPQRLRDAMHVLVVEDTPIQGLLVMLFLERFGIQATLVTDGAQAVAAAKSGQFTLVLMDCQLPVKSGRQATLEIRAWEQSRGRAPLPIVAMTASCMKEQCDAYLAAGMDRVLHKPFSAREFGMLIRDYLLAGQETLTLS